MDTQRRTVAGERPTSAHGHGEPPPPRENAQVADLLDEVADLLEAQHASSFRVRAYRHAADMVRSMPWDVAEAARKNGPKALMQVPGIGPRIGAAIDEIAHTGRLAMRDRLLGALSPEDLFTLLPGVGPSLAERIHRTLHVDSLEELEVAAHDGRLATVPGFGHRRVLAVRQALGALLSRSARRRRPSATPGTPHQEPPVDALLEVDAEYRGRASRGTLPTIAPRRFNPEGASWLPIYHVDWRGWAMTALFSNTARAHALGKTHDWVVIYFERNGVEGQRTIVTEHQGPLDGQRVVRGREAECLSRSQGVRASTLPEGPKRAMSA